MENVFQRRDCFLGLFCKVFSILKPFIYFLFFEVCHDSVLVFGHPLKLLRRQNGELSIPSRLIEHCILIAVWTTVDFAFVPLIENNVAATSLTWTLQVH